MALKRKRPIELETALDLMRRRGTRLVHMHAGKGAHAYYLVPGGYIELSVAEKIKGTRA